MVGKNLALVIIKRKKVIVSGGHHGGAWKVAYADKKTLLTLAGDQTVLLDKIKGLRENS